MTRTCQRLQLLLFLFAPACHPLLAESPSREFYNIHTFGAAGDGTNLDTAAINRAIEAVAQAGGGTLFFPAGTYASYSIHLKSNVGL